MFFLIIVATIICVIVYLFNKELTTMELLKTVGATIAITLFVYSFSLIPFNNDEYFASGRLVETRYYPAWVERYKQSHTVCHSSGKTTSCTTYYTTEYDHHRPYWVIYDNLGQNWRVSSTFHAQVKSYFGNNIHVSRPNKATHGGYLVSGDPNVYKYYNDTNIYKYITTKKISWFNPIKGSSSLFNESAGNFKINYPVNVSRHLTNRLMNKADTDLTPHDWDVLNTKLYTSKGVNLIALQVKTSGDCDKIEAFWNGGEYNDLVVCTVGGFKRPEYVKVFGWQDDSMLKEELETLILDSGLCQKSLPQIQNKIEKQYKQFDFKQFGYIHREPPLLIKIIAIIAALITAIYCVREFSNNYDRRN